MNLVKTFELVSAMSDVRRFSLIRLAHQENVLEHTAFVSLVSLLIASQVNATCPGCLDFGVIAFRSIAHDMDETVTGDIPRPTKYASPEVREMFRSIESDGLRKVIDELGLHPFAHYLLTTSHAASKKGREGLIISIADTLAVVYKAWDEVVLRSNMSMVKVASYIIPELNALLPKIRETFQGEPEAIVCLRDIITSAVQLAQKASK